MDEEIGGEVTGNDTTAISITGTPAAINATLSSLMGQFPAGYNTGNYWDSTTGTYLPRTTTIICSAYDTDDTDANPVDTEYFHGYFVDGENATPNITAPTSISLNQNVPFDFTGINLISFTDPDWEYEDMRLLYCTVSVNNGVLTVQDTSSLNRYSHDANYQTWQFEGYLPWLNQALASLQYTGTQAGLDTLTVTVNDWGNHGGESTLTVPPAGDSTVTTAPADQTATPTQTSREASATVSINVLMTEIEDTPRLDMNGTATYAGGTQAVAWPNPANILDANDADQLDVALRVHHGNLSFGISVPSGVTTVIDTEGPPGDSLMYLRGPQTLLNYTLANLQYTPYAYSAPAPYDHFTGRDLLTVTVMDNDTTHLGSRDPVERIREQRMEIQVA